jgi:hypothetical protein
MSEDIKVHDPASKEQEKQPYDERELEKVLRMRQWRNWDEVISWLRDEGDKDRRLTPGEVRQMVEDLNRLKEQSVPLDADPHEIYKRARST